MQFEFECRLICECICLSLAQQNDDDKPHANLPRTKCGLYFHCNSMPLKINDASLVVCQHSY